MKTLIIEKWSAKQYFINNKSEKIKKTHPWIPTYFFMKYPKLQEIAFIDCRIARTLQVTKTLKKLAYTLNAMNKTVDDLRQSDYELREVK